MTSSDCMALLPSWLLCNCYWRGCSISHWTSAFYFLFAQKGLLITWSAFKRKNVLRGRGGVWVMTKNGNAMTCICWMSFRKWFIPEAGVTIHWLPLRRRRRRRKTTSTNLNGYRHWPNFFFQLFKTVWSHPVFFVFPEWLATVSKNSSDLAQLSLILAQEFPKVARNRLVMLC